ncbi:MAG: NAD+ synthase [Methanomicrobiales archaeon]|jgi:NAD+ synthase/NAD+ synthase (glutamine-hydrolysing)
MRLLLLQLNPIVGDLPGNAGKIRDGVTSAGPGSADLIVTSELALLGYPPRDLLLFRDYIGRSLEVAGTLAEDLKGYPPVLLGGAQPNPSPIGRPLFNVALLLHQGKIARSFGKTLLPTYDVFDEDRYFEPAQGPQILDLKGVKLGISICEDIWNDADFWKRKRYHSDPVQELVRAGARCLINISASPFTEGKQQLRERMLSGIARKHGIPLVYVNQAGGNDDLVFDGRSCAFNASGDLIARAAPFREDSLAIDIFQDTPAGIHPDDFSPESEIWNALVLGTRDYLRKTGFQKALIGLSGGIDSSLVAAVAAEALGRENVLGVLMPSPYSSEGSVTDARALAGNLGIRTITLPITVIMDSFDAALREEFSGLPRDITEENLQARIRGTLLMALSNKFGTLLLSTGNKSEMAVGYCTLYGDMNGALTVLADVPKTMVYRIARWRNAMGSNPIIPETVFLKAPSAELRPGQTDQDTLPPYDLLDEILHYHIEQHESPAEIVARGYDPGVVYRVAQLVKAAEFKRKQAPPGIKVTDRAFGTGWRMPIATGEWDLNGGT